MWQWKHLLIGPPQVNATFLPPIFFHLTQKTQAKKRHKMSMYVHFVFHKYTSYWGGRQGRDRLVVGFATAYANSAYRH